MIPNGGTIIGATAWIDGNPVPGAEEITIPDVNIMTTPINPLGSNGEIEMPIPKIESMDAEVRSTIPSPELAKAAFSFGDYVTFTAYGSYQVTDPVNGGVYAVGDQVEMVCKGIGMGMGTQSNSDGGERVAKFKVVGLTYFVSGEQIFKWSGAPNNEFIVGTTDYMADHRANLGIA